MERGTRGVHASVPVRGFFQITLEELRRGEDVAHCPSCSLVLLVIYDPEDVEVRAVGASVGGS